MDSARSLSGEIIEKQRQYFLEGNTHDYRVRKENLRKLKQVLKSNEKHLIEALDLDFGKSYFEAISNELGLVYAEISLAIRKIQRWTKPERRSTSVMNLPGRSRIYPIPYGNTLVISPWNYPVMLALTPLVSSIAAGNTVILKPSEVSVHTSAVIARILNEAFPRELLYVALGGPEETSELLSHRFDKIFFTGSTRVGKIVLKAAAENLTPVTLELGGKNPVIVMPDCDFKSTVKRLVWGKFHNGGQACVAPDHIYVHEAIYEEFKQALMDYIPKHFGGNPRDSKAYPRIITPEHYKRLMRMIDGGKTILGGKGDESSLYLEPTVMTDISHDDEVMKEEIFGPILPLLRFNNLENLIQQLKQEPSPLAFYIFTGNTKLGRHVQKHFRSGGGVINDVVIHFINSSTPFGGIGESGMGSYHGKAGFDCFSHAKSVIQKPTWFELWVKHPPYTGFKEKIVRMFLR